MELIKATNPLDLLTVRPEVSGFRLRALTRVDFAAILFASCGVGFIPFIPATWGSVIGVGLYLAYVGALTLANSIGLQISATLSHALLILATFLIIVLGVWAASRTARLFQKKDPRTVTIDEVAGQLITLQFLPLGAPLWLVIMGFVLFRCFDVLKPFPANRLESLRGGLGIMADDILAGFYSGAVLLIVGLLVSRLSYIF